MNATDHVVTGAMPHLSTDALTEVAAVTSVPSAKAGNADVSLKVNPSAS